MHGDRLAHMDALRGIAILGVIANHVGSFVGATGVVRSITDLGANGVQLFFVVSAFTIFMTFDRSRERESAPIRNFFIRRLFRIVPVYWFGILLYTAVYGLGSRGWLSGPELSHYPWHIALMNVFSPTAQSSVVPGGWSISCEVVFYLTCPLWFAVVRSFKGAIVATLALAVLGALAVHFLNRLGPVAPEPLWSLWIYRNPLNQFVCFAFGAVLYYAVKEKRLGSLESIPAGGMATAVALLAIAVIWKIHPGLIPTHDTLAAAFTLLAASLSARPWRLLVNGFTVFWGRISYSAYLLHFLVIAVSASWIGDVGAKNQTTAAVLIASLLGTAAFATLMQRTIEERSIASGKRLIKWLSLRKPSPETTADLSAGR